MSYVHALLEEVRRGDPVAAADLANLIGHVLEHHRDRTVADAFGLRRDAAANDKPQTRDELYRDLAHSLGKFPSLRKQAEAILHKQNRYVPNPNDEGTQGERGVLWQLAQIGIVDLSERHMRRILGGK
jgi:hypothetical protein